jgi:hypothetical protein
MSSVRIEAACDDVFISSLCFPGNRESWREKQKPAGESSGFQKNGLFVQKSRRRRMTCHTTRFSAAAAIIGLAGTIQLERVSTVWRACGDETKTRSQASTGGAPNGAAPN